MSSEDSEIIPHHHHHQGDAHGQDPGHHHHHEGEVHGGASLLSSLGMENKPKDVSAEAKKEKDSQDFKQWFHNSHGKDAKGSNNSPSSRLQKLKDVLSGKVKEVATDGNNEEDEEKNDAEDTENKEEDPDVNDEEDESVSQNKDSLADTVQGYFNNVFRKKDQDGGDGEAVDESADGSEGGKPASPGLFGRIFKKEETEEVPDMESHQGALVKSCEDFFIGLSERLPGGGTTVFFVCTAIMATTSFILWDKYQRPEQKKRSHRCTTPSVFV